MRGKWTEVLAKGAYAALSLLIALEYVRLILVPAWRGGSPKLASIEALLGLVVLLLLLALAYSALQRVLTAAATEAKRTGSEVEKSEKAKDLGLSFPAPGTLVIGMWLMLTSVLFIAAFFALISSNPPDSTSKAYSDTVAALYMLLAAGIGASVTGVSAYSYHACEKRDYKVSYDGWYISRPFLAMLLALVFFFGIKAGFKLTENTVSERDEASITASATVTPPVSAPASPAVDASGFPSTNASPSVIATESPVAAADAVPGYLFFAFIGALVGMFSKPASEKLREVFSVIFHTSTADEDKDVEKLSDEVLKKVKELLPPTGEDPVRKMIGGLKDKDLAADLEKALAEKAVSFPLPADATEEDRLAAMTSFFALLPADLRARVRGYLPHGAVQTVEPAAAPAGGATGAGSGTATGPAKPKQG